MMMASASIDRLSANTSTLMKRNCNDVSAPAMPTKNELMTKASSL